MFFIQEIFSMKMFLGIFLLRDVYFGFINSLLNDDEGDDDEDPNDKPFPFEDSHWNSS